MYCQDRDEVEDDLYREEEEENSDGSEADSELEFHLYSQLHYGSKAEEREEGGEEEHVGKDEDSQQLQAAEKAVNGDAEDEPVSLSSSQLRLRLRGHAEARQKAQGLLRQKSSKFDPKDERSMLFQEVIVIDSSTDVITISDDDEDEGVCALKGGNARLLKTSTPAQQEQGKKRKRSHSTEVTVDSSSAESDSAEPRLSKPKSESDSESESSASDSDGLENWMILGRGKQDGDHSISLNLEGGSERHS
ncbi:uncharacterized protein LOC143016737, partial [Genypterus blacodes]|uniref:uncharacterized protein LOC143016737 n=1 Tax=Genypterus blacodes TaxID=154954 RepID=UPI003F7635E6